MYLSKIKKQAKKLKKELGVTHAVALDMICRSYGFSNYKHYLNTPFGANQLFQEKEKKNVL